MRAKTTILTILDGWGCLPKNESTQFSAIAQANTPHWDQLLKTTTHTQLQCAAEAVGLPSGQMGNSEVGHLHIGAGRLVEQDLTRIGYAIENKVFQHHPIIQSLTQLPQSSSIHIMGLLSAGGIHSHENHIIALLQHLLATTTKIVYFHAILDGRDTAPKAATHSITKIIKLFKQYPQARFASISGRYFSMDRDQRWQRTARAYDMLTATSYEQNHSDPLTALNEFYTQQITDEFIPPTRTHAKFQPINSHDTFILMNFRADRMRQITRCFTQNTTPLQHNTTVTPRLITLTSYAEDLITEVLFEKPEVKNSLGEIISQQGLSQLRLAETEKYAHVTFFFNGGQETPFAKESRDMIPSPHVDTYDLQPEMSAPLLTKNLINAINSQQYDLIICNYANADMVGHTGNFPAAIKAVESIDQAIGQLIKLLEKTDAQMLITADHGNIESMHNTSTEQAHTAHTTNPVSLSLCRQTTTSTEHRIINRHCTDHFRFNANSTTP